jgi:cytochrome c
MFLILLPVSSQAISGEQLAKQKKCVACHNSSEKKVGPPFKEIAARYSEKEVPDLVKSVREGSKDKWGNIQMPPQRVSDSEAEQIVRWILSNK